MYKIKVSVIVPVYNAEKFLKKCIESILNQTLKDIEIILINDGSTDASHIICEEFYKKYPTKIKYINNKNIGCSATRNLGISFAKGDYIAFVDSDDYIDKEMYEEMYKKAKKEELDIVVSGVRIYYLYSRKIKNSYPKKIKNKEELLETKNRIANSYNKIFKRKFILENNILFPPNIQNGEDLVFCFKALILAKNVSYIEKSFYNYVQHGMNSVFNLKRRMDIFISFKILYEYLCLNKYIYERKIRKAFFNNLKFYAIKYPFVLLMDKKIASNSQYKLYGKLYYQELIKLKFIPLKYKVLILYYKYLTYIIRKFELYDILKRVKDRIGEYIGKD